MRLELDETKQLLTAARHDLDLLNKQAEVNRQQDLRGQLEKMFAEIALPAAQVLVQEQMLNKEQKLLKAEDIQATSNRLLRVLQNHGLVVEGTIGSTVSFDHNFHQPLALEEGIQHGDAVVIRMCGISYHGKVLRRRQ